MLRLRAAQRAALPTGYQNEPRPASRAGELAGILAADMTRPPASPDDPFVRCLAVARTLTAPGMRVALGLSGGADSIFLLHLLAELAREGGPRPHALYVDHAARPRAAIDAEIALCRAACAELEVPFAARRVPAGTRESEAALRAARHALLDAFAGEVGAARIALGHTASDRAETALFHLLRGAGLRGVASMRADTGRIIRPLLPATSAEVRAWLAARGIPYAVDATNADTRRTRARLRLGILPALEAAVPGASRHLAEFAARVEPDADHLEEAAALRYLAARAPLLTAPALSRAAWLDSPVALRPRLLMLLARDAGMAEPPEARHLDAMARVAAGEGGKPAVPLPGRRLFERDGDLLILRPEPWPVAPYAFALAPPAEAATPAVALALAERAGRHLPAPGCFSYDLDRLALPLELRPARPGERFRPFGRGGETTAKKILQALGVPRHLRPAAPLLLDASAAPLLLAARRGAAAPVSAGTRRTLVVEFRDPAHPSFAPSP